MAIDAGQKRLLNFVLNVFTNRLCHAD